MIDWTSWGKWAAHDLRISLRLSTNASPGRHATMLQRHVKIGLAAKTLGVSQAQLRRWGDAGRIPCIRTPGGQRLFEVGAFNSPAATDQRTDDRITILYSRVSSSKQRNDLQRQKDHLRRGAERLPNQHSGRFQEVSDVGSGINFKRPGLLRVLGLVKEGRVRSIVVASKDRLARFGFDLIHWLCSECGAEIVVLERTDGAPEDELGKDLMAIVQVYCCRWNGRRRYRQAAEATADSENPEASAQSDG